MYFRVKKKLLKRVSGRIMVVLGITIVFLGVSFISAFPAEKVTVTWWKAPHMDDSKGFWEPLIADFEEKNPNIRVEHVVTTWMGWFEKHMPAFVAGTPPDLVHIPSDFFYSMTRGGFLQSIEELDPEYVKQMKKYTYESSVGAATYEEEVTQVPLCQIPHFNMYNKVLFEKAGLDPSKPPNNWDDLRKYAQKIVEAETAKYGVIMVTSPPRISSLVMLNYIYNSGEELLSEDLLDCKIDEPGPVKAIQFMKDLYWKYRVCPPYATYDKPETANLFFQGEAAMYLWDASAIPIAQKYLPEGAIGGYFFPTSQELLDQGKRFNKGSSEGSCIAKVSKHKEEALKLAKYIGSRSVMERFCEATYFFPTRKDVQIGKEHPLLRELIENMGVYTKLDPPTSHFVRIEFVLGDGILDILTNEKKPVKESLEKLAREIESFLTGF